MRRKVMLNFKYKGYVGNATYDDEAKIYHGDVIGIKDVITFQAEKEEDLQREFEASVDDYLEFCSSRKEKPNLPS